MYVHVYNPARKVVSIYNPQIPSQLNLSTLVFPGNFFHFNEMLPWFQRFKINLWLKAAIDSSSRANQFELGSDPDSVS